MSINPFVKPLGICAAALGIVQGVVWIILSLITILIYTEAWEPFTDEPKITHGTLLSYTIVGVLQGDIADKDFDIIIGSTEIFIASIIYLLSSIAWVTVSLIVIWILEHQKYSMLKNIFAGWGALTALICIWDLILTSLLARDYDYIVTEINKESKLNGVLNYAALAFGVLMTLAAKGFALWVVNLVFATLILKLSTELSKEAPNSNYNSNSINAFRDANPTRQGNNNLAYNWDDDKPNFTRSNSFVSPSPQPYAPTQNYAPLQNYPTPPPKPNVNDRLAKIGRPGGRSPPHNVAPPKPPQNYIYPTTPRIPDPDYSPPNSPHQPPLKSALKNRPPQNSFIFPGGGRY